MLLYDGRCFLQGVEGERSEINNLLNRLVKDPRHKDFHLRRFTTVSRRFFSRWSMATSNAVTLKAPLLFQHGDTTEFDPYTLTEQHAASVVGHIAGLSQEQSPTLGEEIQEG